MKRINALTIAFASLMAEAQPAEQSQAGSVNAPSPETIEKMPADARNPSGPVGRSYLELGGQRALKIIGAEQMLEQAKNGETQTRIDGMLEMCNLGFKERATYIAGMESKFSEVDGGTRTKTHQNYITDFRRVHHHIGEADSPEVIGWAVKVLEGSGAYKDKLAQFKTRSNAGGSNKGTGASVGALGEAIKTRAIEALKAEGIENPTGELIRSKVDEMLVSKPGDKVESTKPEGEIEQPKGDTKAEGKEPRRASPPVANSREVCQQIEFLHIDTLEPVCAALAKRLMQQTGTPWVEIGRHLVEEIDAAFHSGQPSTLAGVVLTEKEAQTAPMAQ